MTTSKLSFRMPALVLLAAVGAFGCRSKRDESAAKPTVKVQATCKDAAKRYGDLVAQGLADDPRNPLTPAQREKAKGPIADAVVTSCEEDHWSDLPLSCLASVFSKGSMAGVKLEEAATICAGGAGRENQDKMDSRVARAMANVSDGTSATVADRIGNAQAESAKNESNGAPRRASVQHVAPRKPAKQLDLGNAL